MLFMLNFLMSTLFFFMKHPLSMGMMLLLQTILISLITGNFCLNFWYSYIIFLIMIGGMLILFIYMTSIASNEKFKVNMKLIFLIFLFLLIILSSYFVMNFLLKLNYLTLDMYNYNKILIINYSIIKYTLFPMILILLFLIMYLFFTLIAIVKISNLNKGPLRFMN